MATLFTDGFIADLTAEVNKRLAWIARQPIPSTKKLEQEITNEDRQLWRHSSAAAQAKRTGHPGRRPAASIQPDSRTRQSQ
jgi:hypothetical protein